MNCEQSQQLLIEYIEGVLKQEVVNELETHLHDCAECRSEYEALQTTLARVLDAPVPQPDEKFWNAFPSQVLDAYKKQEQTAETSTPENLTSETTATEKTFRQTISEWLLPNGWPQLAAHVMVVTIAIGGIIYWSFQSPQVQFDSAKLQAKLVNGQNLATVVKQHTNIIADSNSYSFNNTPVQADFFRTGRLYSESLALLAGNDLVMLQKHLKLLSHELANKPIKQQLDKINTLIAAGPILDSGIPGELAKMQDSLEQLANEQSDKDRLLFQLGSWLNDIKLAATLKNSEVLKQPKIAEYLLESMQKQNMPKGVVIKFKQIILIMQSAPLDEKDYVTVIQHINAIQYIMG